MIKIYNIEALKKALEKFESIEDKMLFINEVKTEWEIYRENEISRHPPEMLNSFMGRPLMANTFGKQCTAILDSLKFELDFNKKSNQSLNINPVTMNNDLNSIKHQFDGNINHLNSFFPLINTMFVKSIENKNFELFEGAVKSFNFILLSLQSYQSIEKTISNAKLFLNENELQRFYLFAKDAIKIKREHLNSIIKSFDNELTGTENFELEKIFHSNCNIGIINFPDISLTGNPNFAIELIKAIEIYFENFENEIDKIRTHFAPSSEPISDTPQPENPFPKIFTDEGYHLFFKLQTSFIGDDTRKTKANYSYLYHYLNDDFHKYLLCTQDEYISFIKENYQVSLSKIQPKANKYDDTVKKKLDGFRKNLSI